MQTALHVAQKVLIMEFINELPHARLARPQRALESKNQTDCNAGTVTVIFQASLILMLHTNQVPLFHGLYHEYSRSKDI